MVTLTKRQKEALKNFYKTEYSMCVLATLVKAHIFLLDSGNDSRRAYAKEALRILNTKRGQ